MGIHRMGRMVCLLTVCAIWSIAPATAEPMADTQKLEQISKACDAGKAQACYELGKFRRDSKIPELRSSAAAATAFQAACNLDHVQSCNDLGDLYYSGRGVPQNRVAARALYEDACAKNNAEACFSLAYVINQTDVSSDADARARPFYKKSCEGGYLDACSRYADKLIMAGDKETALTVLQDACKKKNEDSCISLAGRLLWGNPFPVDTEAGIAAYRRGCDNGGGRACFELAQTYANGGIPKDPQSATQFYRRACELDQWAACERYGNALYQGIGVAIDRPAALAAFDAACKKWQSGCWQAEAIRSAPSMEANCQLGDGKQCLALGEILAREDGPLLDLAGAIKRYEMACDKSIGDGCMEAGDVQWNLPERNVDGALRFYDKACALDNADGCMALGARLGGNWPNMVADEPRAARAFAKACARGEIRACTERDRLAGLAPDVALEDATPQYQPPEDDVVATAEPREKCVDVRTEINGRVFIDRRCNVQVINGFDILPGSAPWQALVERPKVLNGQQLSGTQRVLCGGSLVAKGWIVTAAHCLFGDGKDLVKDGYRVRLGLYDVTAAQGLSYPILKAVPHPGFRKGDPTYANDIALIRYDINAVQRLGSDLLPIRTIKLDDQPVGQRQIYSGMTTYAYGWGWTQANNGQASAILKGVKLPLRTETECNRLTRFAGALSNSVLCAGGPAGEQACSGDSGGPLVYYGDEERVPTLIGVVSAGKKCGTMGEPSRYTRVARVSGWIRSVISGATARQ